MKNKIIAVEPAYLSPKELSDSLKAMTVLDIIMVPEGEEWLRRVRKFPEGESYYISNGSGDEMDIFFEENGIFIKGFDHENELNQFAADEWDETFFNETYAGVPKNFLEIYENKEALDCMTFCMWYDYETGCWKQNITEDNDGGKSYLLSFICKNEKEWAEWAEDYYETDVDIAAAQKVYNGEPLTEEIINVLNPEREAEEALEEIAALEN